MLKCGLFISTFIIVSFTSEPGHGSRERRTPQGWDDESRSFHESAELRGPPSTFSRSDHWGRRGPPNNRGPPDNQNPTPNQGPPPDYGGTSDNRALLSGPLLSISLLPINGPPGQNKPPGNSNYGPPGQNKPPGNGNYGPPGHNKPSGNGNNGPPGLNKPPGNSYYGPPGHNKPSGNGNNGPPGHNKPNGNGNNGPPGHNKPNGNGNNGPPGHNKPNGNGNNGPPGHNKPNGNGNKGPPGQNKPSGNQPQINNILENQNNNGYPPAPVTNKPGTTTSSHNIGTTNYYITDKFPEGPPISPDMMFQAIAVTPEE